MRELITQNLSKTIDPKVVDDLLSSYERMVAKNKKGDIEGCLSIAGKFVENALRAIEFLRTGKTLSEIKSAITTVKEIEKDQKLPESIRLLIPRISIAMIYDVRSKRGAVHVKEIDPRSIDAALSVQAASWIVAEFLRLFHSDQEVAIAEAMSTLMRVNIPFIENLGGERVVTATVECGVELLLLLAESQPNGLDRAALGQSAKYSPSSITTSLQRLERKRLVHKTRDNKYHITGPGEQYLADQLTPS